MKKSQIAAALALTYVAGVTLPLATTSANAISVGPCTPSVSDDVASMISRGDIATMKGRIDQLAVYQAYAEVADIITTYGYKSNLVDANVNAIETPITNATDALGDASKGAVKAYDEAVKAVSDNQSAVATALNTLYGRLGYTAPTGATTETMIDNAKTMLGAGYNKYKPAYDATTTITDVNDLKTAIDTFNATLTGTDKIAATVTGSSNSTAKAVTDALVADSAYAPYGTFYTTDALIKTKNEKATAKTQAENTLAAKTAMRTPVVERINKAFDALIAVGGMEAANKPTGDTLTALVGAIDKSNIKKESAWTTFLGYYKTVAATTNNDANKDVYNNLKTQLATVLTADEVNAIFDPFDPNFAICGTNGILSIAGNLPSDKLSVITKPVTVTNTFANPVWAAYDITFKHNGQDYTVPQDEYYVTVAVPSNIDAASVEAYYIASATRTEKVPVVNNGDGTITFNAKHFSTYALTGKATTPAGQPGGPTGGDQTITTKTQATKPVNTKTTVGAPDTGLNANVASIARSNGKGATSEQTAITVSAIAAVCTMIATVVVAVRRLAKRRA